jgi:hypothetical protein
MTCIFHGPFVFDEGDAARIYHVLLPEQCIVAGVMGRTAAAESGLPLTFADAPPSVVINGMEGVCVLVNRGKTPASGRRFGEIVASRICGGLIHIECSDQICYLWDSGDHAIAEEISDRIGYRLVMLNSSRDDQPEMRRICGCIPGEPVMVEGITIGYATAEEAVISCKDGILMPISGIRLKLHGIEKLYAASCPPLDRAWCKSGWIRTAAPLNPVRSAPPCGRVQTIDHAGISLYRFITPDTCGILSIGDDTTAVCGHIGAVLGIPVFGITDGDGDSIVPEAYAPGSVIVRTISGTDDQIGREITAFLPQGDQICWDELVASMLEAFSSFIIVWRDLR